jgi:mono/diheme cytochrome c family protein
LGFPLKNLRRILISGCACFLLLLLAACGNGSDNAIENQPMKPEVINRFKAAPNDPNGDATKGQAVFVKLPCLTCHTLGGNGAGIGPALDKIGTQAGSRVAGVTAAQYIYQVLTNPEDANLPDYRNTTMPSFKASVTSDELRDLVAFLLTLK